MYQNRSHDLLEPAHNNRHGCVRAHRHQEKGCIFSMSMSISTQQHCEARNREEDAKDDEEEAMPGFVGQDGDDHGEHEGSCPWRYRVQLCLDGAVAVALDDRGREVGVAICGNDQSEVHEPDCVSIHVMLDENGGSASRR